MVQFRPRQLEFAGTVEHQVAEIDDVDVQRAVAVGRVAAVAALRFLQRMQPVVERERMDVAVDDGDGVEEIRPLEARPRGVRYTGDTTTSPKRARNAATRVAQVVLRLDVAAQAQVGLAAGGAGTSTDGRFPAAGLRGSSARRSRAATSPGRVDAPRPARVARSRLAAALDDHADRARAAHRAGLAQLQPTCATSNSLRISGAQRSASVSTRPKPDCDTNSIRRLLTAL